MLFDPFGNCVVVRMAKKFCTVTEFPLARVPEKNCTVPVGAATPRGRTAAASVTGEFGGAPVGTSRIVCVISFATLPSTVPPQLRWKLGVSHNLAVRA